MEGSRRVVLAFSRIRACGRVTRKFILDLNPCKMSVYFLATKINAYYISYMFYTKYIILNVANIFKNSKWHGERNKSPP